MFKLIFRSKFFTFLPKLISPSDENKFGKKMLEKMGWSDGKGLGADLSGETSHVKVNKRAVHLGMILGTS